MSQNIDNISSSIDKQLNISTNQGTIYFNRQTRFAKRFMKLKEEVLNDQRYEGIMESLKYYITEQDGLDMPTKLKDGNFNEYEILEAKKRKDKYARQLGKNEYFESAQWIDTQLLGKIKMEFEAFVIPLIKNNHSKDVVYQELISKVVRPVLELINIEGEHDDFLNYNADDILGMVYFLTGKCHLNWKSYDSL